jgi:murein DD-endopeptidase MepM/ murein hydrolase activator NlpD
MKRSLLALSRTLVRNASGAIVIGAATIAMANSASASSAATASDSFRIVPEDVKSNQTPLGLSDPSFRSIYQNWGNTAGVASVNRTVVAVPSIDPVANLSLSSGFGRRNAPRRGASTNHKGLDFRGALGTPIYATADAVVAKAEWARGYGKYIQLQHGNEIETRYGHMSGLNVYAGQRVRKGDVIGYMGSTGRSTGTHLHYEVRISGVAVNPKSFLSPKNNLLEASVADTHDIGGPSDELE